MANLKTKKPWFALNRKPNILYLCLNHTVIACSPEQLAANQTFTAEAGVNILKRSIYIAPYPFFLPKEQTFFVGLVCLHSLFFTSSTDGKRCFHSAFNLLGIAYMFVKVFCWATPQTQSA